jgi:1-deoxy-D-xylulose-5-phosphate reductoisomerase
MTKKISILGSTGSIGRQTLDIVDHHPHQFEIIALAAGHNLDVVRKQALQYKPKLISVATEEDARTLRSELSSAIKIVSGQSGLLEVAAHSESNFVVNSLVGSMGLEPTLIAIRNQKTIGLANKETLISAGHLVKQALLEYNVKLLPIDSEHSAIFQCLNGEKNDEIKRLILTASGGSFRDFTREQLKNVSVEQALNHPNWSMGAKITIDSATMANKGLEIIEAHWLFDIPYEKIDVIIHPESIVHSMVEFKDKSFIAQLGDHDMRIPIQYALTWPNRLDTPSKPLDLAKIGSLHFRELNMERYPCVKFAYECGKIGGTAPTVFNAANEVAVARFLKGAIHFLQIEDIIEDVLSKHEVQTNPDLEEIISWDQWARSIAEHYTA